MGNKKGMTMTSIIIYVILFFVFTIAVTIISSNFNSKLFSDRGLGIDVNSFNKLEYNLLMSGNDSNVVNIIVTTPITDEELVFSNNDTYVYDSEKGTIRKNGGLLISNVISYTQSITDGDNGKLLTINVRFQKYLHKDTFDRTIKVFVEGT